MAATERTYGEDEIREWLAKDLPHWFLEEGAICRRFRTSGWKATLMVVNAVGHLAEVAWHHPDLAVSYGSVVVTLVTHSAQGVTDKDFALARKIEDVVLWRPAAGSESALEGTPDDPRFKYIMYDD